MPIPLDAPEVLNREFLAVRAKLIEVASVLDRMDRADGSVGKDPRTAGIAEALEVLKGDSPDRAEQIQLIFSREYEDDWKEQFGHPEAR